MTRSNSKDVHHKVYLEVLSVKASWKSSKHLFNVEKSLTAQCVIQPLVFVTPTMTKRFELYEGSPQTCFLGEDTLRWRTGFPRWRNDSAFHYMKLTVWKIGDQHAKGHRSQPQPQPQSLDTQAAARGLLIAQSTVDLTKQTGVSESKTAKFTYRFRLWDRSRKNEVGHVVIAWRHVKADAKPKTPSASASLVRSQSSRKSLPSVSKRRPKTSRPRPRTPKASRFRGITDFFRRSPAAPLATPSPVAPQRRRRHSLSDTHSFRIEHHHANGHAGMHTHVSSPKVVSPRSRNTLDNTTTSKGSRRTSAILRAVTRSKAKSRPDDSGSTSKNSTNKDSITYSLSVSGECRTSTILGGDSASKLSVNSNSTSESKRRRSTPNILASFRRRRPPKKAKPRATTPRAASLSQPRGNRTPTYSMRSNSKSDTPRANANAGSTSSLAPIVTPIPTATPNKQDSLTAVTPKDNIEQGKAVSSPRLLSLTMSSAPAQRRKAVRAPVSAPRLTRNRSSTTSHLEKSRRGANTPPATMPGKPSQLGLPSQDDHLRRVLTAERPGSAGSSRPRADTFSFMDMINHPDDGSDEEEKSESVKIGTFAAMRLIRKHTTELKEYLNAASKSPRNPTPERMRFSLNLAKLSPRLSPVSRKHPKRIPAKTTHIKVAENHLRNTNKLERELRSQAASRLSELDVVEAKIRGLALK